MFRTIRVSIAVNVVWDYPEEGWVKINSDGARWEGCGKAASGGVIRSSEGHWIRGYSRNIGSSSVSKAECWGALDGLRICFLRGF